MKSYEKPILTVLSLSGNDQLCGSCTEEGKISLRNNPAAQQMIILAHPEIDRDKDRILDLSEFSSCFGTTEDQCADKEFHIDAYCKFTSTGSQVAWS